MQCVRRHSCCSLLIRRAGHTQCGRCGWPWVFYGLYQSVDAYTPKAEKGEIACWGINECKGTTACGTAFNAGTGQNECRRKGYIYVPEKECFAKGGEALAGSEGDPKRG